MDPPNNFVEEEEENIPFTIPPPIFGQRLKTFADF